MLFHYTKSNNKKIDPLSSEKLIKELIFLFINHLNTNKKDFQTNLVNMPTKWYGAGSLTNHVICLFINLCNGYSLRRCAFILLSFDVTKNNNKRKDALLSPKAIQPNDNNKQNHPLCNNQSFTDLITLGILVL